MKVLSDDEFEELVGKAGAWDKHVAARLARGVVLQETEILCVSGKAEIQIRGAEVVTPFGQIPVRFNAVNRHIFPGDSMKFSHAVKLTLS